MTRCFLCNDVANNNSLVHLHQYIKKSIPLCDTHYNQELRLTSDQRNELIDEFMDNVSNPVD